MGNFFAELFTVLVLIILVSIGVNGQAEPLKKLDFSVGLFGKGKPIVYAKTDDGLPDEINAKGIIVDASISGKYCGTLGATGGTLKLKLTEKVENYDNDFLYVLVLCLAGKENENLIGKLIELKVKKLTNYPYTDVTRLANHIDSGGVPYYLSTIERVGGLIR